MGPGPVSAFEWLMASRRWQPYALRSLTVLLMLLAMWAIWAKPPAGGAAGGLTIAQQVKVGRSFFGATTIVLLGLVGLAAPAATAGSVCLDKARGNLTLLFVTDLSDAEVVLGKLAARLLPVLGLILCAWPVLSIATLFGGVDPIEVAGALLVVLACALFGCSLALTLSVWGRKTHEVLAATYVFGILYLLSAPIYEVARRNLAALWWPSWSPTFMDLLYVNPVFLVVATMEGPPPGMPPVTLRTQAAFLGLGAGASAALLGLATWRIRGVVVRQLGRGERPARRRRGPTGATDPGRVGGLRRLCRRVAPGPSLDRNPVLWRECQRKRPTRWALLFWGGYALLGGGFTLYAINQMVNAPRAGRELASVINAAQVAFGLLLLSSSAATGLAEERQRGSLDVLMATPLSTRSIVWGKWWGAFRTVRWLLILPTPLTFALSLHTGHFWGVPLMAALIVAYGAAVASLGLALATWVPQTDRAVGTTVGLFTLMCLGWVPLSFIVFGDGTGDIGSGVAAGSPLTGVGILSALLAGEGPRHELVGQAAWTVFWTSAYAGVAIALLLATLCTFNRCLGRIDDRPAKPADGPTRAATRPGPAPL